MGKHGESRPFPFWLWLALVAAIGTALGLTVLLNSPASPPARPQPLATFTPDPSIGQPTVTPSAPAQGRTYTVKTGDTLGTIAKQYCGTPSDYQALYAANRKTISNANMLTVGQVITIAC